VNAQDQARLDGDREEVFSMEDDMPSPGQQIRLHFRCLVREQEFGKLGWHLKGILRALFLSDFAHKNHRLTVLKLSRAFNVPLGPNTGRVS
jgi:hypothetical protein